MKIVKFTVILLFVFILNYSSAFAQSTCVTPYVTCLIPQTAPNGYACFCNTPSGPMRGIIGAQQTQQLPLFCCTPAGKFGPFQNKSTPVGGSCYANTQFGVVYGQACY